MIKLLSTLLSFATLDDLLAVTPTGTMQATALDAPGSLLYHDGSGKWDGEIGRIASYPALAALDITNLALSACADMSNPLADCRHTRMYPVSQGVWMAIPGQKLAGETGAPYLLDLPAMALTPGVFVEVYASPFVIPDWMVQNYRSFFLDVKANTSDASSTAASTLNAGISSEVFPNINTQLAFSGGNHSLGRSLGSAKVRVQRIDSSFRGQVGTNNVPAGAETALGAFATEQCRFRLMTTPGAVTNQKRLWSWAIWSA